MDGTVVEVVVSECEDSLLALSVCVVRVSEWWCVAVVSVVLGFVAPVGVLRRCLVESQLAGRKYHARSRPSSTNSKLDLNLCIAELPIKSLARS